MPVAKLRPTYKHNAHTNDQVDILVFGGSMQCKNPAASHTAMHKATQPTHASTVRHPLQHHAAILCTTCICLITPRPPCWQHIVFNPVHPPTQLQEPNVHSYLWLQRHPRNTSPQIAGDPWPSTDKNATLLNHSAADQGVCMCYDFCYMCVINHISQSNNIAVVVVPSCTKPCVLTTTIKIGVNDRSRITARWCKHPNAPTPHFISFNV
jgi:hypothetical protein